MVKYPTKKYKVKKEKYLVVSKDGAKGKGQYFGSYYKTKPKAIKAATILRKQGWGKVRVMKSSKAPKKHTF